jgi:pantetheine-phosphate adenylyltransferase
MKRAIYPGSFDPVTNGHLDVIQRAGRIFDEVIVAVAHNEQKKAFFSVEERVGFLHDAVAGIGNVRVARFEGGFRPHRGRECGHPRPARGERL